MEQDSKELPAEVILNHPRRSLGQIRLGFAPQPGNQIAIEGQTYAILERHHHYQYKVGGYYLYKISLFVQAVQNPAEKSYIEGRWVIGDASCVYNARSELIRCAVNPDGPCEGCRLYEPVSE